MTIPASVTTIGYNAFCNCSNLNSATIHNPNVQIDERGYGIFDGTAEGFILYGHSGSTAESYAQARNLHFVAITAEMADPDFILPANLTVIGDEAFLGGSMTVVYIPNGVTALVSRTFADCASLAQIRIPSSVASIPADVFQGVNTPQLIIFSIPGSAAQAFAERQGIAFEAE